MKKEMGGKKTDESNTVEQVPCEQSAISYYIFYQQRYNAEP